MVDVGSLAATAPAGPRFISEVVRMQVAPPVLRISGTYRFVRGDLKEGFRLLYPFARDSSLGEPQNITVTVMTGRGRGLSSRISRADSSGLHLVLPFDAADSCALEVHYSQELLARRAIYLLTSTQRWGEPLDHATLELDWPDSLGVPRVNFPLTLAYTGQGMKLYRYEASKFLPTRDLVVEW